MRNSSRTFVKNSKGKRQLRDPKPRYKDNIESSVMRDCSVAQEMV
jgi:hypothetical protein